MCRTCLNSLPQRASLPYFLPALIFAHRARAAALIRARPAAEMWRLGLALLVARFEALVRFAHLARCAAAIRLRAAADMVCPVRDALRVFPLNEVRALIAASKRSHSCWSSLTIASRFAMRRILAGYIRCGCTSAMSNPEQSEGMGDGGEVRVIGV